MTREVNALVTDMVDVAHVPEWQVRFAGILGEMLDRTEDLWDVGDADADEVRDMVGQLKTTAESVGRVVRGLRVRTDLQVEAVSDLNLFLLNEKTLIGKKPAAQLPDPNHKPPRRSTRSNGDQRRRLRQDHRPPHRALPPCHLRSRKSPPLSPQLEPSLTRHPHKTDSHNNLHLLHPHHPRNLNQQHLPLHEPPPLQKPAHLLGHHHPAHHPPPHRLAGLALPRLQALLQGLRHHPDRHRPARRPLAQPPPRTGAGRQQLDGHRHRGVDGRGRAGRAGRHGRQQRRGGDERR